MREHPIYKHYYADKEGNVYSNKSGELRMMKPTPNQKDICDSQCVMKVSNADIV